MHTTHWIDPNSKTADHIILRIITICMFSRNCIETTVSIIFLENLTSPSSPFSNETDHFLRYLLKINSHDMLRMKHSGGREWERNRAGYQNAIKCKLAFLSFFYSFLASSLYIPNPVPLPPWNSLVVYATAVRRIVSRSWCFSYASRPTASRERTTEKLFVFLGRVWSFRE